MYLYYNYYYTVTLVLYVGRGRGHDLYKSRDVRNTNHPTITYTMFQILIQLQYAYIVANDNIHRIGASSVHHK